MCFFIEEGSRYCRHIALRDIPCYKIGHINQDENQFKPLYMKSYIYKIGEKQREISLQENVTIGIKVIEEGYHSYSNKKEVKSVRSNCYSLAVVKCIIPKGAEYYYNPVYKEYVSSNIIVVEQI